MVAAGHRDWTEAQIGFIANVVRLYRGKSADFTQGGDEARAAIVNAFGRSGRYRDVLGLCKAASKNEIEAQGWSLNAGRYVDVAPGEELTDEDFQQAFGELTEQFEVLTVRARELEGRILQNASELLES